MSINFIATATDMADFIPTLDGCIFVVQDDHVGPIAMTMDWEDMNTLKEHLEKHLKDYGKLKVRSEK